MPVERRARCGGATARSADASGAADARRRRRARRRLAPDRLQRDQQPRPAAPRHAGPGPGGDRRTRLLAQPGRTQPAHPRLAPDRACGSARRRRAPPTRPWTGSCTRSSRPPARPATTSCSSRARPRDPVGGVRRPAALDRRRRLRRHRHLPRQPAGGVARGAARAVRRLRPAVGQPRGPPPVGRRRRRAPAPSSPPDHLLDRGHQRIAWIGWRKDSRIGEDRRSGWTRAMHERGLPDHRARLAGRGHRRQSGREASARAARRGAPLGVRLRVRHPRDGRAAHAARPRHARRASTSPSSASTTRRSPRSCRPA